MILDKTVFRPAEPQDALAIRAINERAFDRSAEADLVEALDDDPAQTYSFVAQLDGQIVGHIYFSELEGPDRSLALGPLSVDPNWRDFLIGTELTRRALRQLRQEGWRSVFALGDTIYYGRFGFKRNLAEKVKCAYQCANLMALELEENALAGYASKVTYAAPFSNVD